MPPNSPKPEAFTWRGLVFDPPKWPSQLWHYGDGPWMFQDPPSGICRAWFDRDDLCFEGIGSSRTAALEAARDLVIAHFRAELTALESMPNA